jgi:DNA-binding response OmpR family regulator
MTSRHLLLVDDDPQMAVLIGVLARRAGLIVTSRPDIDSAWSSVQVDRTDLVLLDINLPIKSGLEFLRLRRQSPLPYTLPVALFCQLTMPHDVAAGWREGADYLITKDLVTRAGEWKDRVTAILDHARGQSSVPSLGCPQEEYARFLAPLGEALNEALDHPSLRSLDAEVIGELLWRALVQGFGSMAQRAWLVPDTGRMVVGALPETDPGGVNRCFASLIEQVWCLLGSGPCAQFAVALRAIVNVLYKR